MTHTTFKSRLMLIMLTAFTLLTGVYAQSDVVYTEPTYTCDSGKEFETLTPRYATEFTMTNIETNATSNWEHDGNRVFYNYLSNFNVDASAGDSIALNFKANNPDYDSQNSEDLRWTIATMHIDWNQDGTFESSEIIAGLTGAQIGTGNDLQKYYGNREYIFDIDKKIEVPQDVTEGKVRIRLCYTNAWIGNDPVSAFAEKSKEGIVYDFDLNIVAAPVLYAVTWEAPENGTLTVKNNDVILTSGAEVEEGTVLTIEATPTEGYALETITANGIAVEAVDGVYSVTVEAATTIAATFVEEVVEEPYAQDFGTGTYTGEAWNARSYDDVVFTTKAGVKTVEIGFTAETSYDIYSAELATEANLVTLEAGEEFTLQVNSESQGFNWIHAALYIDWNGDGDFEDAGENLGISPALNSYMNVENQSEENNSLQTHRKYTVTVPEGAVLGQARMRLIIGWLRGDDVAGQAGEPLCTSTTMEQKANAMVRDFLFEVVEAQEEVGYAVTWDAPANGTLTVKNNDVVLTSGDKVEEGTVLTIEATPAEGYVLESITANGTPVEAVEGVYSVTVEAETTIAATFSEVAQWEIVKSYTLSGKTNLEAVENFGISEVVTKGSWAVASNGASIELGTTGEENWGPNLSAMYNDYIAVKVDITKPGTYRFEYAHSTGGNQTTENACLSFGNAPYNPSEPNWEKFESFSVPAEREIISSEEIKITEAGTYYFGYFIGMAFTNHIRIADFKLWHLSNNTEAYTVSYEANENAEITLMANGAEIENGTALEEGTEVTVQVTPNSDYEVTAVKANGKVLDGENGSYKFYVLENTNITVETNLIVLCTVSYEENENAEITLFANGSEIASGTSVKAGTEVAVQVVPQSGYEVSTVKANNYVLVEGEGTYKFIISENTTVTVETSKIVAIYNLSYAISEGAELAELTVENEAGETYENNSAVEEGSTYVVKVTSNESGANVVITVNGTAVEAETEGNVTTYTGTVTEDTEIDVKVTSGIENGIANNVYYAENVIYAGKVSNITIYDITGKVVYNAENVESVNVEFLNNGLYIANVDGYTLKFNK